MSLKIKNFTKYYGDKKVLDNVSFTLNKPEALGLVGLNGAGKTTTIRMIIDLIKKDKGEVIFKNKKLDLSKTKIGYLPEERGIYQRVKVKEQLIYFAKLKGMSKKEAEENISYWIDRTSLTDLSNTLCEKLSKGNQQKVQLIIAFMNDPDIIILDEPLSGLDPVNQELIREILNEFISKGKYVIVTSHQMNVIDEFCSSLVMLKEGKVVLSGNIEDIKNEYEKNTLLIKGDSDLRNYLLDKYKDNYKINDNDEIEIAIESKDETKTILKDLTKNNFLVEKFEIKTPTLREIFIEKAGDKNE